jgi:hypothetical protein
MMVSWTRWREVDKENGSTKKIKSKQTPQLKHAKGAGRVAQVVDCLPSKCKVLSSNPSTAPPQKKKSKGPE